jgi:hypothetical protein
MRIFNNIQVAGMVVLLSLLQGCTGDKDLLRKYVADPLPPTLAILASGSIDSKDPAYVFEVACSKEDAAALTANSTFYEGGDSEVQYAVRLIEHVLKTQLPKGGAAVYLRSSHGGKARVFTSSNTTNLYIIIATRLSSDQSR